MAYTLCGPVIVMTDSGGKQEFPWAKRVKHDKDGTLHISGDRRRHHLFEPDEWTAYLAAKRAPQAKPEVKAITAGEL